MINVAVRSRLFEADYKYRRQRVVLQRIDTDEKKGMMWWSNADRISDEIRVHPVDFIHAMRDELVARLGRSVAETASGKMPITTRSDDTLECPSSVTEDDIERVLQQWIEDTVLCPDCRLPELRGRGICQACPYVRKVPSKVPSPMPPHVPPKLPPLPPSKMPPFHVSSSIARLDILRSRLPPDDPRCATIAEYMDQVWDVHTLAENASWTRRIDVLAMEVHRYTRERARMSLPMKVSKIPSVPAAESHDAPPPSILAATVRKLCPLVV